MEPMEADGFDENGWAKGLVKPISPNEAWSLLSPEPSSRVNGEQWAHQALTFFRARISIVQEKKYPSGTEPLIDALTVEVGNPGEEATTRVLVVTTPYDRARDVREKAESGVLAIGGAGFDALVARTKRLWQVLDRIGEGGDPVAPLVLAGVLALVFLAPIVPPDEVTIFGVKGARERLAARGWKT